MASSFPYFKIVNNFYAIDLDYYKSYFFYLSKNPKLFYFSFSLLSISYNSYSNYDIAYSLKLSSSNSPSSNSLSYALANN